MDPASERLINRCILEIKSNVKIYESFACENTIIIIIFFF